MFGSKLSRVRPYVVTAIVAATTAAPAMAQAPVPLPAAVPSVTPKEILRFFWEDNEADMQLALNAQKMTHSPAVQGYARLVVVDSKAMRKTMAPIMKKQGITVAPQMVKRVESRIAPKIAVDFGPSFLAAQIAHLQSDLGRFRDDRTSSNKDVQEIAAKTIPLLQQHLDLAQAVRSWLLQGKPNGVATVR